MMSVNLLAVPENPFSGSLTVVRRRTPAQAAPITPIPAVHALRGKLQSYIGPPSSRGPASIGHAADYVELSPAALRVRESESPKPTASARTHSPAKAGLLDLYA